VPINTPINQKGGGGKCTSQRQANGRAGSGAPTGAAGHAAKDGWEEEDWSDEEEAGKAGGGGDGECGNAKENGGKKKEEKKEEKKKAKAPKPGTKAWQLLQQEAKVK